MNMSLILHRGEYEQFSNPALVLVDLETEDIIMLSNNFCDLPNEYCSLNTIDFPDLDKWLINNGFAEHVSGLVWSGTVKYPLVRLLFTDDIDVTDLFQKYKKEKKL